MLTYNFANKGSDSLYEYLYKCIKNDIILENLDVHEKLPSKRSFAKNLGISVITVENAYEQLMAEGYIYSIPKKGFYVADLHELNLTKTHSVGPDNALLSIKEKVPYLADFTSNQTDSEIFPFTIWARTMRELLNENQQQLMENPPCGGIMALRQAIADYLHAFRGMVVNPEQIIVGAGTEYLYGLLIQLLGDDKIYGIENPGYPKIAKIYDSMHVSYSAIDLDKHGVCIDSLENHQIDIMHLSPSHHFPTGIITPISRRYELLGWASKDENRYIIEDDYDSELRLGGKPIPTLQSIDISDKVIYMNTFTKTLSSTVRISYMVLPASLTELFYKKLSFYSCTVSNFEQYTLARFMESGSFEKHINRLRNYYQNKRDAILEIFKTAPLDQYITIKEEDSGVHFMMKLKTERTKMDMMSDSKSKGIKLAPLSKYFVGQSYLAPITTEQVGIFNVTFEPGCRNNWHIHHAKSGGGQILVCVAGRGFYQEEGRDAVEMKPGDCINIPVDVKHWHGAAPDEWFSHLAIEVPGVDCSNEWCEAVSEKEYAGLR